MMADHRIAVSLRVAAILAVAVISALAVAPAGLAQTPSPAAVSISTDTTEMSVSVDKAGQATLIVRNTASPTNTPLDQPRYVLVEVSGVASGWTAGLGKSAFRLAPGAQDETVLNVAVQPGGGASVTLTVTARMYPLGADQIPGVGPQVDPESTDSVTVKAVRQDSPTRQALETVGVVIWPLIGAAVLLVIILVVIAARRSGQAVALSAEPTNATTHPGGTVRISFTVANTSRRAGSVVLQTSQLPAGWSAHLDPAQVQMDPRTSRAGHLTIHAPANASGTQPILLSATSSARPGKPANLTLAIHVEPKTRKK